MPQRTPLLLVAAAAASPCANLFPDNVDAVASRARLRHVTNTCPQTGPTG